MKRCEYGHSLLFMLGALALGQLLMQVALISNKITGPPILLPMACQEFV
jgi:hypothetical protein